MEAEFRLAKRNGDGSTLRDHLLSVWRSTGQMPEELDVPDIPTCAQALYEVFAALSGSRGGSGFGPSAIGWGALLDYQRCMGIRLSAWECETVMIMDRAALAAIAKI